MHKLLKFLLFSLLILPINVWGMRSISGRVVEIENNKELPVIGLLVYATGNNKYFTYTDSDGYFYFDNSFPDKETVTITGLGYETITRTVATNMGTINIAPSSEVLQESVVIDCQVKNFKHATLVKFDSDLTECIPTDCEYSYMPIGNECVFVSSPCKDDIPSNALLTHLEENAKGNLECIIDTCMPGFAEPEKNKCNKCDSMHIKENGNCVEKQSKPCTDGITDTKTGKPVAKYECDDIKCVCKVQICKAEGYTPNTDKTKCIKESCPCGTVDKQTGECIKDKRLNTSCKDGVTGATAAIWQCKNNEVACIPTKCNTQLYEQNPDQNGKCVPLNGQDCTSKIDNAKTAKYECTDDECVCKVSECDTDYDKVDDDTACQSTKCPCLKKWDPQQDTCIDFNEEEKDCTKSKRDQGATKAQLTCDKKGNQVCEITACDDANYTYDQGKQKCISKSNNCDKKPEHSKRSHRAWDAEKERDICIIDECQSGYAKVDNKCISTQCQCLYEWDSQRGECIKKTDIKCTAAGAISAHLECDLKGDKEICTIDECDTNEYLQDPQNNKCVSKEDTPCTVNSDTNVKEQKYKKIDDELKCVITKCVSGYLPSNDNITPSSNGTSCIPTDGECSEAQINTISNATKGSLKKAICYPTECKSGYKPSGRICETLDGTKCSNPPLHSAESYRTFNENGEEVCHVVKCKKGYKPDDTKGTQCVSEYTDEDVKRLEQAAKDAKDTEQSLKNRLLGGGSMAAAGIGGMELAQGIAEQKADKQAENDMTTYLGTFRCEYGPNVADGGEAEKELPGANTLFELYNEYQQVASDLKETKEALGMAPGIESQVVLDKANSGLYDDTATGKTNGTFASLSRAISDKESVDAARTADEQSKAKTRITAGAITSGTGIAAGITGNILLNKVDWDNKKSEEESAEQ